MDKVSKEVRSRNMSLIRTKNTQPELLIRKELYKLGLRYRIHYSLPGKPDIVFPSKKLAIFVQGCFWHGHGCKVDHIPRSNKKFWFTKIINNKMRDIKNSEKLNKLGWKIITTWECEIRASLKDQVNLIAVKLTGSN